MSFTIHSKLTDILNSILNMTGINQKEELKSVLISKGLTINDSDTLADMIIKLNTTNLGDAQPSDVIKDKILITSIKSQYYITIAENTNI